MEIFVVKYYQSFGAPLYVAIAGKTIGYTNNVVDATHFETYSNAMDYINTMAPVGIYSIEKYFVKKLS